MKPRIAVFLQPQHAEYDQIRKAAKESEEIGADVIYNWDHFYPLYKEDGTPVSYTHLTLPTTGVV